MTTPDPLRAALSLVKSKIEVARPSTKVFGADNAQVTLRITDLLTIYRGLVSIPAPTAERTYTQADMDSILRAAFPLATPDERARFLPPSIPPAPTVWLQCSACGWAGAMGPECEWPKDCSNCGVTYMTGPGARGPWLSGPWAVDPRTLVPPASPEWLQTLIGHLRAREAIDHDEVSGRAADALSRCVVPALDRREVVARKLHELEHSFGFDPDHWNRLTVGEQAQYRTNADAILAALQAPGEK